MKMRGCSDPAASPQRPAAAHHLAFQHRVEQPGQHATSQIRHGSPSASCISARRVARASPSSPPIAARGHVVSSVAASRSAASTTAPNASAGAISIAESNRRAGSRHASKPRQKRGRRRGWSRFLVHDPPQPAYAPHRARATQTQRLQRPGPPAGRQPDSCPLPQRGCFSSAKSGTGAKSSATARTSRRKNTAGGVSANGSPALSSATMPKRNNAAATRPARSRSGVTSAARAPGVSSASRKHQRNGLRFLLLVGRRQSPQPVYGNGALEHPIVKSAGRQQRPGQQPEPSRAARRSLHRRAIA